VETKKLNITENKLDFKNISLQLYGKRVKIIVRENSLNAHFMGKKILDGMLIGRIWGDKLVNGKREDTVIALVIRTDENKEIEISCKDISSMTQ